MKKLYLIFALLFSLNLNAQTYAPMAQDSLQWHVNWRNYDPWQNTWYENPYIYYTQGDTSINGLMYYKMYSCHGLQIDANCLYPQNILGFLREENKKVYFKVFNPQQSQLSGMMVLGYTATPADTVEKLIYDYNRISGDTIIDFATGGYEYAKVISDTSTILISQQQRKVYDIGTNGQLCQGGEKIIEEIGSTYGLFELYGICFEGHYCLQKFVDLKTNFTYVDSTCLLYVSIDEFLNNTTLSIYSSGQTIYIKQSIPGNYTYKLYNMNGSLVTSGNVTGTEIQVNVTSGIYLLSAVNSKGMVKTFKITLFE